MHDALRSGLLVILSLVVCVTVGCATPNYALRDKAHVSSFHGDQVSAEKYLVQAIKQDPTDWEAQYMLGGLVMEQGRLVEAEGHLERAWSLRDRHAETSDILDRLAEAIYRQDEQATLFSLLKRAAEEYKTTYDYVRQAWYLGKVGDVDNARLALRKAYEFAEVGDPLPHTAAADFYESMGDEDEAILSLRRALWVAPRDRKVAERLRGYGIVPGPTIALRPEIE